MTTKLRSKDFFIAVMALTAATTFTASSASAYYFWDQGFVYATVNTAYTSATQGTPGNPITLSYCLFPPPDLYTPVPQPPPPFPNHYVINMPVCSITGPTSWQPTSLAWAQNGPFGAPAHWVLDMNNETSEPEGSFASCNYGPPDLSLPRSSPGDGVMGFSAFADAPSGENFARAHLVLNLTQPNPCNRATPTSGAIPFMSLGAQDNRGNGGLVGALNPSTTGVPSNVRFKAKLWDHKTPVADPVWGAGATYFRLVAIAQWQDGQGRDVPRMIQLNLFHDTLNDGFIGRGWNWPISQAFYFPGADIAYIDVEKLPIHCSGYSLPTFASIGQEINYEVDLQRLFRCASDGGLFREAMPSGPDVPLRGVHWSVEGVGSDGWLWVSVHDMQMY